MIQRLPANDYLKPHAKNILLLTFKLLEYENEDNVLVNWTIKTVSWIMYSFLFNYSENKNIIIILSLSIKIILNMFSMLNENTIVVKCLKFMSKDGEFVSPRFLKEWYLHLIWSFSRFVYESSSSFTNSFAHLTRLKSHTFYR